jgi:lipopolysaccharide export system protein LptA
MYRKQFLLAILCGSPGLLAAQERACTLDSDGVISSPANEPNVTIFHDPFIGTCDDGTILSANSGRLNNATRDLYLSGDVFFEDVDRRLTAQEATYNGGTEYLVASGNVVFEDKLEGSTLRGPNLEYFRATETRPEAQMSATGRPVLTLNQRDSAAVEVPEPIELVADRVTMLGEDDLSAFGSVVITRSDLHATSGEARYNSATEELELRQNAIIVSREYELAGEVVQARLVQNSIEFLHARTNTSLMGEELQVTGDDLKIFFVDEQIDRAVAIGLTDPEDRLLATAASPTFRLEADSLDAAFEGERLSEVYAIGNARGESIDSTAAPVALAAVPEPVDPIEAAAVDSSALPPSGDELAPAPATLASDWIRGDTIIGYFVPQVAELANPDDQPRVEPDLPPTDPDRDESTAVDLRRLVAIGAAQSLYRLRAEDDPSGERRTLNFLTGQRIELEMADGELAVAEVVGLQYGMYLEPSNAASRPAGQPDPSADADTDSDPDGNVPRTPGDI